MLLYNNNYYTGPRFSMDFLKHFNDCKIDETLLYNVQNFWELLPLELKKKLSESDSPCLPISYTQFDNPSDHKPKIEAIFLSSVLESSSKAISEPCIQDFANNMYPQILQLLKDARLIGSQLSLPLCDDKVPIINLSNVGDKHLIVLHSLLSPHSNAHGRQELLKELAQIVPYVAKDPCCINSLHDQTKCLQCNEKFGFFSRIQHACYKCGKPYCKKCPPQKYIVPRISHNNSEPLCSDCYQQLCTQDVEDWINTGLQLIDVGTLRSVTAALGCLTIALCLSDFSAKPIITIARSLYQHHLPELALPLITSTLQRSVQPREKLSLYVLGAQVFKALAEKEIDPESKWNLFLVAKDSCNLALETASDLSGIELMDSITSVRSSVSKSLKAVVKQEAENDKHQIQQLCSQFTTYWHERNWELFYLLAQSHNNSASFLVPLINRTMLALAQFFTTSKVLTFLDKLQPEDRSALLFFRGILKIFCRETTEGVADIEQAAFHSHHHEWLKDAVLNIHVSLMVNDPNVLFPQQVLKEALTGELTCSKLSYGDRCHKLLFPQKKELTPPFSRNWPELLVVGLNIKCHDKFENAVVKQVKEGKWGEWEAGVAYLDYIPACSHPAEIALCILNAAMWFLKHLEADISRQSLSEIFATKSLIVHCLQVSHVITQMHLHPGMKFSISRLCLSILKQTMQITDSLATQEEAELSTNLLHLMVYNSRFCPIWSFPSVPLSEAVLLSLKTATFHKDFLIQLQTVDSNKRPMTHPEMLYQIHENNICHVCELEDSERASAQAMEALLKEKGWKWEDVVHLMTSPLSPRDSEGWLIQSHALGIPMEFATLKGFVFNTDSDYPSIKIVTIQQMNRGDVDLLICFQ